VQADNGNLTLSGDAQSQAAKDLAGSLASNTDGVRKVDNQIRVSGEATAAAKTQNAADDAGQAISDTWITSKVKSSFIYSRNLDGLDISVTTKDGQVSLGGSVSSDAQKQLAVETARNIRGVRGVNADALKVAG
jgi:osmotically-inducible protein OsmY